MDGLIMHQSLDLLIQSFDRAARNMRTYSVTPYKCPKCGVEVYRMYITSPTMIESVKAEIGKFIPDGSCQHG